ncbi:TonB-dependent receptor, partial [candidate division KSB1 bacterium]|nr:TonB-dependent receptor [candidate division KSB1 bacterium]
TNLKLTYNMSPNHKLSFGFRSSNSVQLTHAWPNYYTSLMDVVSEGQAKGISDGMDNDGDGRIDEEIFNGVDDDGDGVIDESDGLFVDPAKVRAFSGWEFGWGKDTDGDSRVDEEAYNGVDDDGDGRIDEDCMMPFDQNGFDIARRYDRDNRQFSLNWTHTLSEKTFYELRLSYNDFNYPIMPARGMNPGQYTTIDELEDWVFDYDAAQDERSRLSRLREQQIAETGSSDIVVPDITTMIEPNWAFGTPSEPYVDSNSNGKYDAGEPFTDGNGNGLWDYNNPTGEAMFFEGQYHPFRGYRYQNYTQLFWNYQTTKYVGKFDITSQVTNNHQLKSGIEWNYMRLYSHLRQYLNPYNGRGLFSNQYTVFPNSAAFYMQDKMEFKSAIVNAGLRIEYFDPGKQVADEKADDPLVPGYQLTKAGLTRVPDKRWSVLPRFGISFPVTDNDVFHFFYGHFFQMPALDNVYNQANQRIDSANSIVGNPGLEPEKTISYEFGIRHAFGLNTMMSFTGFFKDIDNLMQIGKVEDVKGNVFRTYLNDTYGTVRGIELLLNQRAGNFLSGEASYTYQVATTSHSNARDTYGLEDAFADLPGKEYPADWDQRHALTVNVDFHFGNNQGPRIGNIHVLENWNLNILHTQSSGLPYTPETATGTTVLTEVNSLRTPWVRTTDLRMRKFFGLYGTRLGLIFEVYNLFDRENVIGVDEGGIIDAYRNRVGYSNATPASRQANYGGFANSIPSPFAWEIGRRLRLGFSLEF